MAATATAADLARCFCWARFGLLSLSSRTLRKGGVTVNGRGYITVGRKAMQASSTSFAASTHPPSLVRPLDVAVDLGSDTLQPRLEVVVLVELKAE